MYSSFYWFSVDKGTKNTEHFLYSRKTDLYMDLLQRNHQLLLKGINCTFRGYLHARIEWEDRLIGIFGSRGVGKTTLLLQHIKLKFEDSREALYVNLDDFFPDEKLDSTMVGKSQNQMSRLTFDKSKQYANNKYKQNEEGIHSGKLNYMFLEISKDVRRKIQPIGK